MVTRHHLPANAIQLYQRHGLSPSSPKSIRTESQLEMLLLTPKCIGLGCENILDSLECWHYCDACRKTIIKCKAPVYCKIGVPSSCAVCEDREPTQTGICTLCTSAYPNFSSKFILRRMEYWWQMKKQCALQAVFMRRWLGHKIKPEEQSDLNKFVAMTVEQAVKWQICQRFLKRRTFLKKVRKLEQKKHQRMEQFQLRRVEKQKDMEDADQIDSWKAEVEQAQMDRDELSLKLRL